MLAFIFFCNSSLFCCWSACSLLAGCVVSGDELFDAVDCSDVALEETLPIAVEGKSLAMGDEALGTKTSFTVLPWDVEFRLLVLFASVGLMFVSVFIVEFSSWPEGYKLVYGSVAATLEFDTVAIYSNVMIPITNTIEFDLVDINNQSAALLK